jgi:hypothetical protein
MTSFETALLTLTLPIAAVIAIVVIALIVKSVIWVGRDARERGFSPVWLLQLLMVVQFPWPFLAYWLVTRNMDRLEERRQAA